MVSRSHISYKRICLESSSMGRKRKLAVKSEGASRLHGREGLTHKGLSRKEKVAKAKTSQVKKEAAASAPVGLEAGSVQQRKAEEKKLVHRLIPILMDKRRGYMKESRGAGAANTSKVIAQLHEEIGEYLEAATAFVAAAQEILEAHEVGEDEKAEKAKEYFSKAAENYEKAGKAHKAQWAEEQGAKAGGSVREAA
jgi:hypothetical protein